MAKEKRKSATDGSGLRHKTYFGLAAQAQAEFSDVGDYIWKSLSIIDAQLKSEAKKLYSYYPLSEGEEEIRREELRRFRWSIESQRISSVFPNAVATGNLFLSASLFESYMLKFCRELEVLGGKYLSEAYGQGIGKILDFVKQNDIDIGKSKFNNSVQSALTIRNCLFHASGLLSESRDANKIRNIVEKQTHLSPHSFRHHKLKKTRANHVIILQTELGDKIEIRNDYSFMAHFVFRDFFCDIYEASSLHNLARNEIMGD